MNNRLISLVSKKLFFAFSWQKIISLTHLSSLSGLCIIVVVVLSLALTVNGIAAQKQQPKKSAPREQPKLGGTLVFGLGKEFANPNPFLKTSSISQFVKETAYESLLTEDEDGRIVPNLAESFKVSAKGTAFTLHLRKDVKFHNGLGMKADDVIWSTNHVKDPKNGAFGQDSINDMRSIEKIDDYTVVFSLSKPSVTFLSYLANIRMLPIVPANSLKPGQLKLDKNTFIPGTGPFVFEQYQPGFDTVLKKSTEYWGRPAYLDRLTFKTIADGANRFNALRTGDINMADRLSILDVMRIKKGELKGITILEEPFGGYQQLIMNYLNPLFQKLEMRQAMLYAMDKQRLVDEAFFGAGLPTSLMMDPKSIWGKAANLPPHKRDLDKAKTLLKAAGYRGQELVLIGNKSEAKFLESLQRILAEADIKVKIEILEAGVVVQRMMEGKYDLHVAGGRITSDPVITMMPEYYTTQTEKGLYSSSRVDQLFDNLTTEFDEKKRLKIFQELALTLHRDVADIPLFFEFRYLGMSDKVQGFGPTKEHGHYSESGNYFKNVWLK